MGMEGRGVKTLVVRALVGVASTCGLLILLWRGATSRCIGKISQHQLPVSSRHQARQQTEASWFCRCSECKI